MVPPKLTDEQRVAASARAVANRRRRAQIKKALHEGSLRFADVLHLAAMEDVVASLRVHEVLISLPNMGPVRTAALMKRAGVSATRRLRGLGARQRQLLSEALGER